MNARTAIPAARTRNVPVPRRLSRSVSVAGFSSPWFWRTKKIEPQSMPRSWLKV
ncbi:hypothetical protein [Actinomadura madurae]|uniref:hypothetical protein n=1 Tax=Actinomadura madurae TaxID=1993 RepID=UPI003558AC3C